MSEPLDDLMASFHRCRRDERFVDSFYEIFLSKSPEIGRRFEHTDFKIQRLMLRESLLEMLCFDRGLAGSRDEVERLGRRHHELEISPEMYSMWLDALCEAVQRQDPDFTPALETRWRQAMQKGIDVMITSVE